MIGRVLLYPIDIGALRVVIEMDNSRNTSSRLFRGQYTEKLLKNIYR
jgi:hypothetical protein